MRKLMTYLVLSLSMLCGAVSAQTTPGEVPSLSPMQFNWIAPTQRENGVALTTAEIGGFELRYRLKSSNAYLYVNIPSGIATTYSLEGIGAGEYEYQIAVYDKAGLYSNFVIVVPAVSSNPKPVTGATAKRKDVDVKAKCIAPSCKVAVTGEYK